MSRTCAPSWPPRPPSAGVLDVLWPELTPQQLLARLYQEPELLDLNDDERAAIARATPGPGRSPTSRCSTSSPSCSAHRRGHERAAARERAAEDAAERAEALEYAEQLVDSLREDEAIVVPCLETETFVAWIADRNAETAPAARSPSGPCTTGPGPTGT